MAQRKVNLDSHEEELAAREQAIGGALKEAKDAAAAAEAAKKELEMKVAQLEADLRASSEELAALNVSARRTLPLMVSCRVFSLRGARSSALPRIPMQISS